MKTRSPLSTVTRHAKSLPCKVQAQLDMQKTFCNMRLLSSFNLQTILPSRGQVLVLQRSKTVPARAVRIKCPCITLSASTASVNGAMAAQIQVILIFA